MISSKRGLGKGIGLAVLVVSVILGVLAAFSDWLLSGDRTLFPVKYVRIEGDIRNLDEARLARTLSPAVTGGYFFLDIDAIEAVAQSFAWVDRAQVERLWPDTVVVRINEHKPVAVWAGGALVNSRGDRFTQVGTTQFDDLPVIDAPAGTETQMLAAMAALNDRLGGRGLKVVKLDLSKRHAWVVTLSSGLEMHVGRQDPLAAMDHFLELIPKLGEDRVNQAQRIDLRYPSGFSIVWKPGSGAMVNPSTVAGV